MATDFNQDDTIQFTDGVPLPSDGRIEPLLNAWDIKWGGAQGEGATLTYSFPGSGAAWRSNYSDDQEYLDMTKLNASQQAAVTAALQTWSDVADITFELKVDSTTVVQDVATLRFGIFDAMEDAAGWGYLPGYFSSSGDVWLHPDDFVNPSQLEPGSYGFATLIHEVGHALGLSHPNDNGMEPGFDARTTVMSYRSHPYSLYREDTGDEYIYYGIEPDTPMPRDILAIQYLYGANMNHATGDDLYTFDTDDPFIRTIWDAGGTDTISVSNFTLNCRIDLGAGKFSNIKILSDPLPDGVDDGVSGLYDGRQNLAIAYNVTIENATGGAGKDTLVGNGVGNVLIGNDGNDKLDGKGGVDELTGGNGNDTYTIDNVAEIDGAVPDAGTDLVKSKVTYVLGNEQEKLTLSGSLASNGTGNGGDNVLKGSGAVNMLDGSGGSDMISGGLGADILTGGAGADMFRFDSKIGAGNVDRITDFTPGEDVIHLSDAIFLRLRAALRDEAESGPVEIRPGEFQAVAGGKAVDAGDRIIYNTNNGALFYDPDGTGAKAPIKVAVIEGAPTLTVDDFFAIAG